MILVVVIPIVAVLMAAFLLLTMVFGTGKTGKVHSFVSVSPVRYFLIVGENETEITQSEAKVLEKDGYNVVQR